MEYFKSFNDIPYKFGQEESTVLVQDLSSYVDIIDELKDDISVYEKSYISEGVRPDQLSYQIYGTTIYHWTFYLLNDNLRLQGWPLTATELEDTIKYRFDHTVLTTRDSLASVMKPGQTVTGSVSGAVGVIEHRNLDFGQLVIEGPNGFKSGEAITSQVEINGSSGTESVVIVSSEDEYNAAHHYVSNGSSTIVDIDPAVGPGQLVTEISNYDWYRDENEKLRDIKVIRPNIIENLAASYKQAISA